MWKWLQRLLRLDKTDVESVRYDLYAPKERRIYRHIDGLGIVRKDPLILYKRLKDVWPELAVNLSIAESPSKEADKNYAEAIDKIKKIFDVEELGTLHGGMTQGEIRSLLDHFLVYTETVKKNSSLPATPSEAPLPSSAPIPDALQPTSNSSASGSTESAPDISEPKPSPEESPLPSALPTPEESISSR